MIKTSSKEEQKGLASTVTVQRKTADMAPPLSVADVFGALKSAIKADPSTIDHLPVMPTGAAVASRLKIFIWHLL